MSAKDYEVIAAALRSARRAAQASGSQDTVAGVDRAIAEVGDTLRRHHKGSYAWKQSRWDEATEFGQVSGVTAFTNDNGAEVLVVSPDHLSEFIAEVTRNA